MSDTSGSDTGMRVDTEMVQTLAQLLSDNDLTEIEVADGERRITVKRKLSAPQGYAPAAATHVPAPPPSPTAVPATPESGGGGAQEGAVSSPMVGTVYLSAEPGSKPFVSVGDKVEAGDTLLIIEAMKVMNQIPAPKGGTVQRILVQNAEPVEFGQSLVIIG